MQAQSPRLFLMNPLNINFLRKQVDRPFFSEMSTSGLRFLLIFFLVGLAIFLILAIPAWKLWFDLNNAGVTTRGQVVDFRYEDRDVSYFYVVYNFQVGDMVYQNSMKVPWEQYDLAFNNRDSIPVRYVEGNPGVSKLDAPFENYGDFREGGTFLGGGFLLILLIALLIHRDRRLQNSELVANGTLLKGTVLASSSHKPEADSIPLQLLTLFLAHSLYVLRHKRASEFRVKICYSFISPGSNKEISKTETAVRNDLHRLYVPEVGTPVAILYRSDRHFRLL